VSKGIVEDIANEDYKCELLLCYSLSCKYHLLRVAIEGISLPRSLFHSCWWLNGPSISKIFIPWKLRYALPDHNIYISQQANDLTRSDLQIKQAEEQLIGLAKARYEAQVIKTNRALVEFAGMVVQDDLLPTRLPDKIKKSKWTKPKKSHDKASKRSMTGAEATK
jgi:hypothetical protein